MLIDRMTADDLYPKDRGTGLDLSARPEGFGAYGDFATAFPPELLIPRHEWQARCQEIEETRASIPDLCDLLNIPVKDQGQTNYCWANAPVHCVEIIRGIDGQANNVLSAASVAAQITGYRNVGGWGLDALKWIVANGIVPDIKWPNNAISRSYATADNLSLARRYRVTGWWELEPNNTDQLMSCLFRRIPVAVGYNWWGHEVTAVKPRWIDGEPAYDIDNSWGLRFGTRGRATIQGSRMLAADAVAPRVVNAY